MTRAPSRQRPTDFFIGLERWSFDFALGIVFPPSGALPVYNSRLEHGRVFFNRSRLRQNCAPVLIRAFWAIGEPNLEDPLEKSSLICSQISFYPNSSRSLPPNQIPRLFRPAAYNFIFSFRSISPSSLSHFSRPGPRRARAFFFLTLTFLPLPPNSCQDSTDPMTSINDANRAYARVRCSFCKHCERFLSKFRSANLFDLSRPFYLRQGEKMRELMVFFPDGNSTTHPSYLDMFNGCARILWRKHRSL